MVHEQAKKPNVHFLTLVTHTIYATRPREKTKLTPCCTIFLANPSIHANFNPLIENRARKRANEEIRKSRYHHTLANLSSTSCTLSSHQREPGNRSTAITVTTHQTVHVILFPRRQRATTASAWRQLGVPSCTSASGCPWYQDNTSPEEVIPLHVRENTRKKREGTGATTRPSLEPGENPSGERGGRGAWNEDMCRKKRCRWRWEREGTISPRSPSRELAADEGVAGRRARGRGKGDGWWKQTGAAATRRVSRSLCRAWKKRGEGRGSSKAAGKAGSSTHELASNERSSGCLMALFDATLPAIRRIRSPFLFFGREEVAVGESGSKCWVVLGLWIRCARACVCVCRGVCAKYLARMREEFF